MIKVKEDNNCYFCSILYLFKGSQDQQFAFRKVLCDYVSDEHSFMYLQSDIPSEYKIGRDFIDKIKIAR